MTLLIVDADHQVYRSASSCEPTKKKPFLEEEQFAIARAEAIMADLRYTFNDAPMELYIGGEGNWRYGIYPEYKANRKDKPRPTHLNAVREHLVVKYGAHIVNDREVDDECGIRLTQEIAQGVNKPVLVSLDKDLKTVPGNHYNFVTRAHETVSPVQALRYFYGQVITGDQSDNVPAFDGKFRSSTPQFVQRLLNPLQEMTEEKEMYEYCLSVYEDECGNPMRFEEVKQLMHRNASVLYIMKDYNDKWQPPGHPDDSKLG
jgi:DNA polymerase-1